MPIAEMTEFCAANELTIWGSETDVTLFWGESGDMPVPDRLVTWFCEGYQETTECPLGTDHLWVVRSQSAQFQVLCYDLL